MLNWAQATPAVSAAFLGAFVEFVEAFTIVLAAAIWRLAPELRSGGGVAPLPPPTL